MKRRTLALLITALLLMAAGCRTVDRRAETGSTVKVFLGARLIDGRGGDPIEESFLLIRDGRVEAAGVMDPAELPKQAEQFHLKGRTIIPGLINSHGHVGSTQGLRMGAEFYSRENVLADLNRYARYGVTTVLSLGGGEAPGFEIRDQQDDPNLKRARLFLSGPVLAPSSPEQARQQVREAAARRVDFVKIRVDDYLGQISKMPRDVYREVIHEAHRLGLRVAAHVFYLDDAKQLLRDGVDFLAHSVRDQDVDQELITLLKERNVCLCPTLTRELSAFVYETTPDFFEDPFLLQDDDQAVLEELKSPERQQEVLNSPIAQRYKIALEQAKKNLKQLVDQGVPIAFGTDSGPPARFQGYFEHLELEMMSESGLEPMQILLSATSQAASCLGLSDVGTLEAGKWADFVVLSGNPASDISQSRSVESVWIAGNRVR